MIPRSGHYPEAPESLSSVLERQGIRLLGVASPPGAEADRQRREYREWIGRRLHGSMTYLERHQALKYDPSEVLPGCRSVVMVGMNYYQERTASQSTGTGRVARYAWGRDYHNALGKRLKRAVRELRQSFPGELFRALVDASPLSERHFAERAGIGFTGKNTLTISSAFGSWFFLGEILTTVEYPPTCSPLPAHNACPASCFRCGDACTTGALISPYRIDASRCISYLTIEHRGSIPAELRPLMGTWIFGCDLCQEACPLNVRAVATDMKDFVAHRAGQEIDLESLLGMDEEEYVARFAGTPLRRPGRDAMVRNACIAAANAGATHLGRALQNLTGDRSPVVREHARWALEILTHLPGSD